MVHNPLTFAAEAHNEMQKAIDILKEVKNSIINSYALKTGLSRSKFSHLMEAETWMDAGTAIELGFTDGIIERVPIPAVQPQNTLYFPRTAANRLMNKLTEQSNQTALNTPALKPAVQAKRTASDILWHLDTIKNFI